MDNLISGNGISFNENGDLKAPQYTIVKVGDDGKFFDEGLVTMTGFTH